MRISAEHDALRIPMTAPGPPDSTYQYDAFILECRSPLLPGHPSGHRPEGRLLHGVQTTDGVDVVPTTTITIRGSSLTATLPWSMSPSRSTVRPMTTSAAHPDELGRPLQTDAAFSDRRDQQDRVSEALRAPGGAVAALMPSTAPGELAGSESHTSSRMATTRPFGSPTHTDARPRPRLDVAADPEISPDRRFVAFTDWSGPHDYSRVLVIARVDGSGRRVLRVAPATSSTRPGRPRASRLPSSR